LKTISNERGFTLIEALIAMVILTIALVSLAELMAITLRMQMLGRNQTAALRLAQDKIDELMTQNFNTNASVAISDPDSLTEDVANFFDTPQDADGNNLPFKRRWKVEAGPVDGAVPANSVRVLTVRIIPIVNDYRTSPPIDLTTLIRCWPCA
jgi:prepilin-type N-terminal cleavage/methylation domain-containing protein